MTGAAALSSGSNPSQNIHHTLTLLKQPGYTANATPSSLTDRSEEVVGVSQRMVAPVDASRSAASADTFDDPVRGTIEN